MATSFRAPTLGLIVDNFAGGGGASLGIEMASWAGPDIAINHDPVALSLHAANHPHTQHLIEDVWAVDPRAVTKGRHVSLAWFSPDCKHFSRAKGGKPVEKHIRGLAWVVIRWAVSVRPTVIALENVQEFEDWGPLNDDGMPCAQRRGRTFRLFVQRLEEAGYRVEWRSLCAADYGAPTIRRRLFLVARCDGRPIVWPAPTHGRATSPDVKAGRLLPWRAAAECIDWSIPCPSIFARERPLADKTLARIAKGLERFVFGGRPFIVPLTHAGDLRTHSIDEPLRTITGAHRGEHAIVAPFFIPRHGERPTQEPRCKSVADPMPVVTATANGASLVAAFMAQHNGGMVGHPMTSPVSTLTGTCSHQQLVAAFLTKFYGTATAGADVRAPLPTVTAGGDRGGHHVGMVNAFLTKFYGDGGQLQGVDEPMHTATAKARFGLVTVAGVDYRIVDIGMRMLTPRELFRAQGFPNSYIIDRTADGAPITKTDQIRLCGNSVSPPVARALLAANFSNETLRIAPPPRRRMRRASAAAEEGVAA